MSATENRELKRIAILGSTGSIGTQALEVVRRHQDKFSAEILTAQNNAALLIQQALEFKPSTVVIGNESLYQTVFDALDPQGIKVYSGQKSISAVMEMDCFDIVLAAMVGYAGLQPVIRAIENKKNIALANKETLVVAGNLVTKLARENGVNIYPVDSEHSAIFQCLVGEFHNPIEKVILTASGGPFRGKDKGFLKTVTKQQALKHPNWSMGAKISIDSATLMNKGLEVIEAKWLFGLKNNQIEVVLHPQSIIHSLVQFEDGSLKAQMGLPDMKLPIQYAFSYPSRVKSDFPRFNFLDYPTLTFEQPDLETFPNLRLAFEAMEKGGNAACILNAANEVAVDEFLKENISFLEISDIIADSLAKISFIADPNMSDLIESDRETRAYASELRHKV